MTNAKKSNSDNNKSRKPDNLPRGRAIKNGCSHGDGECLDHTFMIHYDKLCRVLWQMWKQKP